MSRADCDDQFSAIFCTGDDGKLSACMQALPTATCGTTPMACGGTLDAAPAIAACNAYLERVCAHDVKCMAATKDECLTAAKQQIDCSRAVGARAGARRVLHEAGRARVRHDGATRRVQGRHPREPGRERPPAPQPGTTVLSVRDALATPRTYPRLARSAGHWQVTPSTPGVGHAEAALLRGLARDVDDGLLASAGEHGGVVDGAHAGPRREVAVVADGVDVVGAALRARDAVLALHEAARRRRAVVRREPRAVDAHDDRRAQSGLHAAEPAVGHAPPGSARCTVDPAAHGAVPLLGPALLPCPACERLRVDARAALQDVARRARVLVERARELPVAVAGATDGAHGWLRLRRRIGVGRVAAGAGEREGDSREAGEQEEVATHDLSGPGQV